MNGSLAPKAIPARRVFRWMCGHLSWFHSYYVPEGTDPDDPRLSPVLAKDLAGLPPAYIVTAGLDPLRGDASPMPSD